MVKPFEDAAWALKDGQISGIVESGFGFHIIKRTGFKPAEKKSFDELKPQIERAVRSKKRNEVIRDSMKKWRDEAQLEIFVKGDPAIINTPAAPLLPGKGLPSELKLQKAQRLNTQDPPVKLTPLTSRPEVQLKKVEPPPAPTAQ